MIEKIKKETEAEIDGSKDEKKKAPIPEEKKTVPLTQPIQAAT